MYAAFLIYRSFSIQENRKMETIFDHNVTKRELEMLTGFDDFTLDDLDNITQIGNYAMLYDLYSLRGNDEKALYYLNMIPDSDWKIFSLCNHDHATRL